ncbi:MAG: hypothetical protein JWR80_2995 [Bradyrhizobium sp.]|nr:hypothetical protein [Bradyrhizobium sp.]
MQGYLLVAGEALPLALQPGPRLADGRTLALDGETLTIGQNSEPVVIARDGDRLWLHRAGRTLEILWRDPVDFHAAEAGGDAERVARAPMPGAVVRVAVAPGDAVTAGDVLLVIESMKLETSIRASLTGLVEAVHVEAGQAFERDAPLVTLTAEG